MLAGRDLRSARTVIALLLVLKRKPVYELPIDFWTGRLGRSPPEAETRSTLHLNSMTNACAERFEERLRRKLHSWT